MPYKINVSLAKDADAKHYDTAKKQVEDQGGKVVNEYKLIKGFTAEFPDDKVHSLSSNEHINVENDGVVKTQ
ncbi:Putative peptidase S8 propeptide/proteinase inhibitor I9 [Septoria linicola]|uniref:Peptidase S8 propeptide/proteinase inhibitor I9 n=1 Tax=Septoria linicola TaxID=215465 RepID=A0A9Q9AWC7_9PEZI|nr:putative peptidase S8 propeptide/proteinase inhibitor I9 [Septoria linicola]USW53031.1 Putative peptidase S8 propeptide/proteinase inhibitor I9 [Septoria linicola]